jgi:hypothetical protein
MIDKHRQEASGIEDIIQGDALSLSDADPGGSGSSVGWFVLWRFCLSPQVTTVTMIRFG